MKVANLPSRTFVGEVSFVSSAIEEDSATAFRFFRVETVIDNADQSLKPNVSGYAKVHVGKVTVFGLIGRNLVRWLRLRFIV